MVRDSSGTTITQDSDVLTTEQQIYVMDALNAYAKPSRSRKLNDKLERKKK